MLVGRREDVEDAAAHGDLPTSLDQVVALIAQADEFIDELVEHHLIANHQAHRCDIGDGRHDGLEEGAHRRDEHIDGRGQRIGVIGMGESPHDGDATADGVRRG